MLNIDEVAYDAISEYKKMLGVDSVVWKELPDVLKACYAALVVHVIAKPEIDPEQIHAEWFALLSKAGWSYGKETNFKNKTNNLLVPFEKLSKNNQAKSYIFKGVVLALTKQDK